MEPFEVLGAVAAVSQLLTSTIKCVGFIHDVYESFRDAPAELESLATKFDLLRQRIEQIKTFGDELSAAEMEDLFPENHRLVLFGALQRSMEPLDGLRVLKESARRESFRVKLSWAALDKRRAKRVLIDISGTESDLDRALRILQVRLNTLNATSLGAIRASQEAVYTMGANIQSSVAGLEQSQGYATRRVEETKGVMEATKSLLQQSLAEQQALRVQSRTIQNMLSVFIVQQNMTQTENSCIKASHLPLLQNAGFEPVPWAPREKLAFLGNESVQTISARPALTHSRSLRPKSDSTSISRYGLGKLAPPLIDLTSHSIEEARYTATRCQLRRKVRGKRIDIQFQYYLYIFNCLVLQIELRASVFAKSWLFIPSISSSITAYNIRSADAEIFKAVEAHDFHGMKALMDNGNASIHDVCVDGGYTLLGVLLKSITNVNWRVKHLDKPLGTTELMISYLIRQGCDPNIRRLGDSNPHSSVGHSLLDAEPRVSTLLLELGAELELPPFRDLLIDGSHVSRTHLNQLHSWRALGCYEFDDLTYKRWLMDCHCTLNNGELLIRSIEEDGLDVNLRLTSEMPLVTALERGSLSVASVLDAYGAKVISDHDLENTDPGNGPLPEVLKRSRHWESAHFLLGRDISPGPTWDHSFAWLTSHGFFCSFDRLVCMVHHLLLHHANCHPSHEDTASVQAVLRPGAEQRTVWTRDGLMASTTATSEYIPHGSGDSYDREISVDTMLKVRDKFYEPERKIGMDPGCWKHRRRNDKFGFHKVISTREGRRRLARYPVATAYNTAVQLAGYRAELDDDGDMWWSDDDADRYVDAREEQPDDDEDDAVGNCPMCQDPDSWGLGHFRRSDEEARAAITKFRERRGTGFGANLHSENGNTEDQHLRYGLDMGFAGCSACHGRSGWPSERAAGGSNPFYGHKLTHTLPHVFWYPMPNGSALRMDERYS